MIAHARNSVLAAWQLVVRDPKAWDGFDLTADGFFRSFTAVLLVIPFNIVFDLFALRLRQAGGLDAVDAGGAATYTYSKMAFSTTALCVEWLLFIVIAYFLLKFLGFADRYVRFVVAYNWGCVIVELFNLPAVVLFSLGLVSYAMAVDLIFIALGLTLYYRFYIAQTALEVGWGLAMGIAVLEFLFTIFFGYGLQQVASLWVPA